MTTGNESLDTRGASRVNIPSGAPAGVLVGLAVLAVLWLGAAVLSRPLTLPAVSVAAWSAFGMALGAVALVRRAAVAVAAFALIGAAAVLGLVVSWAPLDAVANFPGTWVAVGLLGAVAIGRSAR